MNEIQQAYLIGVRTAQEAILAELSAGQELAATAEAQHVQAAMQEQALIAAMQAEAQAAQEAEMRRILALDEAMTSAFEAGVASATSPDVLRREEAYQIGVAMAEAEAFLKALKDAQVDMDDDLKSACVQGYDACAEALPKPADSSGKRAAGPRK